MARFSTNYANKPNETKEIIDEARPGDELRKSDSKEKSPKSNPVVEKSSFQTQISVTIGNEKPPPTLQISEKKSEEKSDKTGFKSFEILKILGSGSFGKVFLVKRKSDARVFAMKALKKRDLIVRKQLRYAVTEVNVLKRCNHPFILTLHSAFQVISRFLNIISNRLLNLFIWFWTIVLVEIWLFF